MLENRDVPVGLPRAREHADRAPARPWLASWRQLAMLAFTGPPLQPIKKHAATAASFVQPGSAIHIPLRHSGCLDVREHVALVNGDLQSPICMLITWSTLRYCSPLLGHTGILNTGGQTADLVKCLQQCNFSASAASEHACSIPPVEYDDVDGRPTGTSDTACLPRCA